MVASNDSAYQGIVRFPNDSLDHGDPLDTGHVKDGLVNTLEQLYNGSAQVRINAQYRTARSIPAPDNPRTNSDYYRRIRTFRFPLMMAKDGTPAPLYVEILGAANPKPNEAAVPTVRCFLRYLTGGSGIEITTALGAARFTDTPVVWTVVRNLADDGAYLRIPNSRPPILSTHKTRNHPDEDRPIQDVQLIEAALDVYAFFEPGTTSTTLEFWGIWARESPWNNYG